MCEKYSRKEKQINKLQEYQKRAKMRRIGLYPYPCCLCGRTYYKVPGAKAKLYHHCEFTLETMRTDDEESI